MSTNIVHVLTVIGKAANEVEAVCEELLSRREERRAGEFGTDDWSERQHEEIRAFCKSLIGASRELPVHYYAQYLDGWSVADSRFMLLDWPDGKRRQIFGTEHGIAFYPSDCCQSVLEQIAKWRRRKVYRTQTEDRWYLDHMREAIQAALWLEIKTHFIGSFKCGFGRTPRMETNSV